MDPPPTGPDANTVTGGTELEPGTIARVEGLQSRTDLNGGLVKIVQNLKSGRVSVSSLDARRPFSVSIKPENLRVCDSHDALHLDGNGGEQSVNLEVQGADGSWSNAGPINLVGAAAIKKDLSEETLSVMGSNRRAYKYRHSADKIDENLLIFLHGAGDTHVVFDRLGEQMNLPQTATLSIDASMQMDVDNEDHGFVELPFGLGFTWFEEMDYQLTGDVLQPYDSRRVSSLAHAVRLVSALLDSLTKTYIPERVFLFGFSSGGCLAMESCRAWHECGKLPLGGAICVRGGIRTKSKSERKKTANHATDVLIMSGSDDVTYSVNMAKNESRRHYPDPSKVVVHVQQGKGHEMISGKEEMQVVMNFLSKRLVRRTTMPGIT